MSPYDHPEYLAFIDRIRERPDDDNTRLICADWLEEQGKGDRATFIRCQIEKAELERAFSSCKTCDGSGKNLMSPCPCTVRRHRWRELAKIEEELWKDRSEWMQAIEIVSSPTYSRGFLESLRIRGADWVEHSAEILKRNPVRKVTIVMPGLPYNWDRITNPNYPGIEFTFEREEPAFQSMFLGQWVDESVEMTRQQWEALAERQSGFDPAKEDDEVGYAAPEPQRRQRHTPAARDNTSRPRHRPRPENKFPIIPGIQLTTLLGLLK